MLEARASGREGLGVLDLLDLLYLGQEEGRAFGALRELVFALRRQFGPGVVERKGPLYVLGRGVVSDLEAFLHTPHTWLWRGRYLDGLATDQVLWARVFRIAREAAQGLLCTQPQEAFRLLCLLAQEEPYDQGILAMLLQSLEALEQPGLRWRMYQKARMRFLEVGLALPEDLGEFLRGGFV
jgi:hypothetical protein